MMDYSKTQIGDIWMVRGPGIGVAIAAGEEVLRETHAGHPLDAIEDGVEGAFNQMIPSHALLVYDPLRALGAQMTAPKPEFVDLKQFNQSGQGDHIVGMFRCPALATGDPKEAMNLRLKLRAWMAREVAAGPLYGYDQYFAFLGLSKQDYHHVVCSQWTLNAYITVVGRVYNLGFPDGWIITEHDCAGLIDPLTEYNGLKSIGWEIKI